MKKRRFPLHQIVRAVLAVIAFSIHTMAMGAEIRTLTSRSNVNKLILENDVIYTITQNVTITASGSNSALKVADNGVATINIPKGLTLSVFGGDGNGRISGGAGIYVPQTSRLIITGEGTLYVQGGRAGNGGNGGNGANGWLSISRERGAGGQGGTGGFGGGGAGAAIGGAGGDGHAEQAGPGGIEKYCGINSYDFDGNVGYNTLAGYNGVSMGNVYIMGTVTVNARGGAASTVAGNAGNWGSSANDKGSGWTYYYTSGSGGPGGGGGSGYGVQYGLGGGAPGAQCGATGASGGTYSKSGSWQYNVGGSGAGGRGNVSGAQNDRTPGRRNGTKGGAQSNSNAAHGGHGKFYSLGYRVVGGRSADYVLTDEEMGKNMPAYLYATVQFDNGNNTSDKIDNMRVLYGVAMKEVKAPKRSGYHFQGFYDQKIGGNMIYDSNGKPQMVSPFTQTTTLYAQWTASCAQNVNTRKMYTEKVEDAINEATPGDDILLYANQRSVHLNKAVTLDLGGVTIDTLYVSAITGGTAYILNGTVKTMCASANHEHLAGGRMELDDISVGTLYADGHLIIINSGKYDSVINQVPSGTPNTLSSVTIKGEDTYVGSVNDREGWESGSVVIIGGWYASNPVSTENNVVVPGYAYVSAIGDSSGAYSCFVGLRSDFINAIHLKDNYLNTGWWATDDMVAEISFMLRSMPKNTLVPIFGSTDNSPSEAHKGFGLYVNTEDRSFVFATGTEFFSSPSGMAQVGKTYYVKLGESELRIDTVRNSDRDYYHEKVPMYQLRDNGRNIAIGRVAGSNYTQCDIDVYDFTIRKSDAALLKLVPAFGIENTATDLCFYDELTGNTVYDSEGHAFDGEVGICNHHPAYRVGVGIMGKRTCVICGQQEEPERFLEYGGEIISELHFNDLNSASRFRVHYADSYEPYLERTVTSASLMRLADMKLFSVDVVEGSLVKHHLVPVTSCDRYFLCDTVTNIYYAVNEKCNGNFEKVNEHDMEETDLGDGMTMRICHGCGANNGVSMNGVMTFNTGVHVDDNTKLIVRFKADRGIKVNDNLLGAKDGHDKGYNQMIVQCNSIENFGNSLNLKIWSASSTSRVTPFIQIDKDYVLVIQHGDYADYRLKDDTLFVVEPMSIKAYQETLWLGCHNAYTDQMEDCLGHFTIFDCKIFKNNEMVSHLVPSKYENDMSFYDICDGSIHKANWKATPSSDRSFIPVCTEHTYLNPTPTVVNGTDYLRCLICNELVEDTRSSIRTNGTSWLNTGYVPTIDTRIDIHYIANSLKAETYILGAGNMDNNAGSFKLHVDSDLRYNMYGNAYPAESGVFVKSAVSRNSLELYNSRTARVGYRRLLAGSTANRDGYSVNLPLFVGAASRIDARTGQVTAHSHSDITIYGFDIYENNKLVRSFTPMSQDGIPGFYESFENLFYPMGGSGASASIHSCGNHLFSDYSVDAETGKWIRHCRICNGQEEVADDAFVTNNGGCYFDTGYTPSEKTRVSASVSFNKSEGSGTRGIWYISPEEGHSLTIGSGLDKAGLPVNVNIYSVSVYEDEDLVHFYLPSLWNGKPGLYDVMTDTHVYADNDAAPSAYVPDCNYHRYFQLETKSDEDGLHIYRHCKLCDAVTQLNGIVVAHEDTLRRHVYADNGLTLHFDLVSEKYEDTYVGTAYPEFTDQDIICGIAVMKEGQLQEYFLPAIRRDKDNGIISGMYNAVRDVFVEVPGATVAITACDHSYSVKDYVDGKILSHCHICDEVFGTLDGNYMDIWYDSNGGTGMMGNQRITTLASDSLNTLRNNGFTYGAHYFAGWELRDGSGTRILHPGDRFEIPENMPESITLYAHWNDGFICNGDTLEVNAVNTADIHIIDDGNHGFEATGNFKAAHITYERPLDNEDQTWGTLCLPFEISSTGSMQLYSVAGTVLVNNLGRQVTALRLIPVDKVDAGMPCIFEITQTAQLAGNSLVINADNVEIQSGMLVHNSTDPSLGKIMLLGSYVYNTILCESGETYYAIQGDTFYHVDRALTIRPYHAYMQVPDSQEQGTARLIPIVKSGEDVTSIFLPGTNGSDATWFTIDGESVAQPHEKGIYIIRYSNGKSEKILVR